ncbi:hypothetical protein Lesp02_60160 [Lentzea sp. NBRC 105346]|uniref:hypothetical protein n=1 Tax=Lentzea sp. NBRC 105346 TaxID=3032205 RepID=UPI00255673AC|nr:hypothetical protein [Lentzea sp. NBRC 105346]GLZ33828.1 hypothetical protein Lesp02_60160 [Lentzea sp. NBRC 105346]
MQDMNRRRFLAVAGAAAAVPALGSGVASASADTLRAATVRVVVTEQKITMTPSRVPAGLVRFEVSTPDAASIAPGIFRLRGSAGIDKFLEYYVAANSRDLPTKQWATGMIDKEAEFLGGAAVTNVSPMVVTAFLRPGRHYVFNYNAALTPYLRDSILPLEVGPRYGLSWPPAVDDVIVMRNNAYEMPSRIRGRSTFLVHNATGQVNEVMFLGLTPDATADDVRAFWAAVLAGKKPPKVVVTSLPEGLAPLSAGGTGIVTTALPPGKYMVTTFMYDRNTWLKGIFQDFWKIVTVC